MSVLATMGPLLQEAGTAQQPGGLGFELLRPGWWPLCGIGLIVLLVGWLGLRARRGAGT